MSRANRQILTLDYNVFVGATKGDELHRKKCLELLGKALDFFFLSEPSIDYEEVCGAFARRAGFNEAQGLAEQLDRFVPAELLFDCGRGFCLSSYSLCSQYGIYAIDALYLSVAIRSGATLVSLDREDFVDKLKINRQCRSIPYI